MREARISARFCASLVTALGIFAGIALLTSGTPARAAGCGTLSIAEMTWGSAAIMAHIDKIILETGFGCTVELVPGDTMPTFASMDAEGRPDIAPEIWAASLQRPLDEALRDGRLIETTRVLTDGGVEGWWIPRYVSDAHPDIKTVQDALKHPDLFPSPRDESKGAVHNCPSDWNCQIPTANLYRALKGDEAGFELINSGSAAGLDSSIAQAFADKKGWLGYYWAPTAILGKYEMVKLSFGVGHDRAEWNSCTAVPDCSAPVVNGYPTTDVYTIVTRRVPEKAGSAPMVYLAKRQWDNQTVNSVLAHMDQTDGNRTEAAQFFLKTFEPVWSNWLPPDIVAKVKAAL
ncbi:ABC transporter substrate-binding protein [Rhizobium sp. Leaf384]|jgi:glycine betaine/proline transport system substrate-binding protein|nr:MULTISPECIES: glycine betaine ABC transporter substrate-binding protein [unclassified Rhizobium]KQR68892.1 ABC transporter substrate-binding protein [Rhizobium sp. Leaf341]KQS79599.1 ABC transporter substrate-binding protein [Rhizobium sp. Leaf384]KQS83012.1 ABC transporter substrate-binding protein [Rhizobium sp. Leaf383]